MFSAWLTKITSPLNGLLNYFTTFIFQIYCFPVHFKTDVHFVYKRKRSHNLSAKIINLKNVYSCVARRSERNNVQIICGNNKKLEK